MDNSLPKYKANFGSRCSTVVYSKNKITMHANGDYQKDQKIEKKRLNYRLAKHYNLDAKSNFTHN